MYNNLRHCAQRILAEEGIAGLWLPGMGASMLREITYSSVRVGLYPTIRGLVAGETDKPITLSTKIAAGNEFHLYMNSIVGLGFRRQVY